MSARVTMTKLGETHTTIRWVVELDREFDGTIELHCKQGVVLRFVPAETLRPSDPLAPQRRGTLP